jgi:ABC-type sugar transport system permease subunit
MITDSDATSVVKVPRQTIYTKESPFTRFFAGRSFLLIYALVPAILFYTLFWILPIFYGFFQSFTDWSPMSINAAQSVGLENYQRAFTSPDVRIATRNSITYALFVVLVRLMLALPLAMMLNSIGRGKGLLRLVYFLPVVTSLVAVSIIWRFLYMPRLGLFNLILASVRDFFGLGFALPRYLLDPSIALYAIGVMDIWRTLGFQMVILMAGLSSIPEVYYEAARIDGADRRREFRHVTLPLLQPTILFVLVTSIAGAVQVFTEIFVMMGGQSSTSLGGGRATNTLVIEFYKQAFRAFEFGYASAIAMIIFVLITALSLVQLWLGRRRWDY